ncbi:MAG: hypothetical protein J2P36_02160 [Ktedonobacteraceae bacterium]|nr:hypothetical protein [Ktedonobacteraceae bacterium]
MANAAIERAYGWVKRYLTDDDVLEEWLWGNALEGGLEVHPPREDVFALLPRVLRYLVENGDRPAMDPDVQTALYEYLSDYQSLVFASEAANQSEEFAEEITNAYVEVCERLTAEV